MHVLKLSCLFHLFLVRMMISKDDFAITNYKGSEEHTSELQSLTNLVCRLLLEKKKTKTEQLQ